MDLTLLEIHLEDAVFTANAPLSGQSTDSTETDDGAASEDDESRPSVLPFAVGLIALAIIAYAIRRLRSKGNAGASIEPEVSEVDSPTP